MAGDFVVCCFQCKRNIVLIKFMDMSEGSPILNTEAHAQIDRVIARQTDENQKRLLKMFLVEALNYAKSFNRLNISKFDINPTSLWNKGQLIVDETAVVDLLDGLINLHPEYQKILEGLKRFKK